MKTILITGCSSGFGLDIARYFLQRDWKVIATLRTPKEGIFPASDNLTVLPLDVTDTDSIQQAIAAAGPIDVLVNNAGIGLFGIFENLSLDTAREIFETNTFGTMAMIQAVLPQFREKQAGVIVNVTSSVTLIALPMLPVYTASKAAVNAFTESLALELAPFNIRLSLVLPGKSPETRFGENARSRLGEFPPAYAGFAQQVFEQLTAPSDDVTTSQDVAEAVWRAVNDPSSPMRIAAGKDAVPLLKA
ncbi:Putative short-chain dehydrogenase, oxidoreductase [Erwinia billingiae Eb661]|uniref:Putative short-chain dehydrogenase, oxidoreductase n=1 Tax=Erwinia billingiae (strain Eb661) TaxID=634500 RepID=D8MRW9_ERWBE|nr:SDR family oxidoreductase [Erwinia billingiae]CAX59576.1 Putative short-chain dehydrogenase, oxidoreductase [Erwinia billingiae Eb661]